MKRFVPHIFLVVLVCVVYSNTLHNSFHYDDIPSILEKPWVRGLDKIPMFITNAFIRPVVILSYNLNYAISGFEVWSFHVFNIIFHAGVVLLLYQLVLLTGRSGPAQPVREGIQPVAFLAAMIFALHPLNTQSVTYIASRSSELVTLFYLATLILFFKGWLDPVSGSRVKYYLFAGVCLALGALSKEIIITIPALLFLYHFYFVSGQSFRQWIAHMYVPILLIAFPLAGFIIYRMVFTETGILPTGQTYLSSSTYLLTQTSVIPFEYFWKMLFPINLNIDIHYPILDDWTNIRNYGGIFALVIYLALACFASRKDPWIGFGMLWAFITVLPTSSFVPLHDVAVEHRTYLPLIGFAIAASALFHRLLEQLQSKRPTFWKLASASMMVLLVLLATLLLYRNLVWKDEITLWSDAKSKSPHLIRTYNNLGEAYDKRGDYEKAMKEFESALKIDPDYTFALNNLGNIHGKLQNYGKAIEYFEKVIRLKEDYAPAHYNLARAMQSVNRGADALEHYKRAIDINPDFEAAIFNHAMLSLQTGHAESAEKGFRRFIELQPGNVRGHFGLGNALIMTRQFEEAIVALKQAVEVDPKYILAGVSLANAQTMAGKVDDAIATYTSILKGNPAISGVHKNLGLIYLQHKNDVARATRYFEESLRLDPNQPEGPAIRKLLQDLARRS